jgi:small subunit ribosomal protein S4
MGDPRKQRKKYSSPAILWNKESIDAERTLLKEYGLKNKREIWKSMSILKRYTDGAKKLIKTNTQQADIEKIHLLTKLKSYGLLEENSKLDEILALQLKDILERRLQTQVFKLGLARSVDQARQFIVHEHVMVADKIITSPSYMVPTSIEQQIQICPGSSLENPEHPERTIIEKKAEAPKKRKPRKAHRKK